MKIYIIKVTSSCTLSLNDDVNLDSDLIINATTDKEKAIKIADEYVNCIRMSILDSYNGVLPDSCKFDDGDEDIGERYISYSRRIYDMELKRSMFDYREWMNIEIITHHD